jgi:hypothetical protein
VNRAVVAGPVAVLAVAVIAYAAMLWKPKPSDTAIVERPFHMNLPGKWTSQPSSDPTRWSYQAESQHETLTVSFVGFAHGLKQDERESIFRRAVELRRSEENKLPGLNGVMVTDATFGQSAGVLAARYGGVDSADDRRLWCLLLGSSVAVTIFYYEAVGLSEGETDARGRAIFNSIVVPR